jgi:hypothetical protein
MPAPKACSELGGILSSHIMTKITVGHNFVCNGVNFSDIVMNLKPPIAC